MSRRHERDADARTNEVFRRGGPRRASASLSACERVAPARPPAPVLVHNFGDALTALPLGIAFYLRSFRGEKLAGLFVVLVIFVSACVALDETIMRFIHPQTLSHLWVLAAAGAVGFVGNEIVAQVRLRAGRRLSSPALIADGNHARVDGFVSLGVITSALIVSLGAPIGDPIIGLVITVVILKITWDSGGLSRPPSRARWSPRTSTSTARGAGHLAVVG